MSKEKKRRKPEKKPADIDIGIRFSDVFKGVGSLFDVVSKMVEKGQSETMKTGKVKGSRAIYGYSIKIGTGGIPIIDRFGNIFEGREGPIIEEKREPLVDIFDEEDHVRIIAELPGVEEKDIKVNAKGDRLTISAHTQDRRYHKEILLTTPVKAKPIKSKYKNGVLELKVLKKKK